jgi:DNA-binding NtrC family response regulator
MLKRLGYTPLVAAHPREALAMAAVPTASFDLLLTDVVMPEMTGRQLHLELTNQRPGLRAVYMSGYAPTGVLNVEELGSQAGFLPKPFTLKQLGDAVAEALGPTVTDSGL